MKSCEHLRINHSLFYGSFIEPFPIISYNILWYGFHSTFILDVCSGTRSEKQQVLTITVAFERLVFFSAVAIQI